MDVTNDLQNILEGQDQKLDQILTVQKEIRSDVTERNWINLEQHIAQLSGLSKDFSQLENQRVKILETSEELSSSVKKNPLFYSIHKKLVASRAENDALNSYISITRGFLQGIFDKAISGKRNTLYSRNGAICRPNPESILLNTLS